MHRSRRHGQGIVEMVMGGIVLVMICLLGIDLITLVLANSTNDTLAKSAARAAANQESQTCAQQAAQRVVAGFAKSAIINDVELSAPVSYGQVQVSVETKMLVSVPAPLPGVGQLTFHAKAVEPIVGTKANI